MLYVASSISQKTGVAPRKATDSGVAKKVNGVVNTASPGLISIYINAISSASVPLEQAKQYFESVYSASFFSRIETSSPKI